MSDSLALGTKPHHAVPFLKVRVFALFLSWCEIENRMRGDVSGMNEMKVVDGGVVERKAGFVPPFE